MLALVRQRGAVWLTWEKHRRTLELATALQLPLVYYPDTLSSPFKYLINSLKTVRFLLKTRPKAVIVQNPSLVLAWLALLLKPVLRYTLILDNHNQGIIPHSPFLQMPVFRPLYRWLHAGAAMNIVTNAALVTTIRAHGGTACLLPDKLPTFVSPSRLPSVTWPTEAQYKILFICTYATDEPVGAVINAARLLQGTGLHLFVTGKPPGNISAVYGPIPENLHLLGFLSEEEFIARLQSCDAIMDLTDRENCLLCGAYEAVAARKPLLTSDTAALRAYFRQGTVYAKHTPECLAAAMQHLRQQHESLAEQMQDFQPFLEQEWQQVFRQFSLFLESVIAQKAPYQR